VRIIAATNKNLATEVEKGQFREDLYYRLNVIGINIPPLKERKEDIPELVNHFVRLHNAQLNKQIQGVDPEIMAVLIEYEWKGNVRELENAIERAMILCDGHKLTLQHFPHLYSSEYNSHPQTLDLKSSVRKFEQERILKALEASEQDKSKAAEMLGLSLSSLYRKISELGIPLKDS
jgi:transcriptional regulator with PAS, ATPase and Fis domain